MLRRHAAGSEPRIAEDSSKCQMPNAKRSKHRLWTSAELKLLKSLARRRSVKALGKAKQEGIIFAAAAFDRHHNV